MKLIICIIISIYLANATRKLHTYDVAIQRKMFVSFKHDFDKSYDSEEHENSSFEHFVESLKVIDQLNSERVNVQDAQFDITHFADMNKTNLIGSPIEHRINIPDEKLNIDKKGRKLSGCDDNYDRNTNKDWSTGRSRLTTAVKNCGNCLYGSWAFSVAEQIESDVKREYEIDYILSPQQLLHCVTNNFGCGSTAFLGSAGASFQYLQNHGLQGENTYPYRSSNGQTGGPCRENYNDELAMVSGFFTIFTGNEGCMTRYVQEKGPLAACFTINMNSWFYYSGGVMSSQQCSGNNGFVCAQITAVKLSGHNNYWKVRGSFGTSWGEGGFIRLSHGDNTCLLTQEPIYTEVYTQGEF